MMEEPTMNLYETLDLPRIINAAGKMTYLGSSAVSPEVARGMAEAARNYVDMASLKQKVGEYAAQVSGAEAAFVTVSAAAGIAISVAACLTGTDMYKVESLPDIKTEKREVILQKGHSVHFGANITQMIRLTGAVVKEIGTVNGVRKYHLQGAITPETAAVLYVVSHHAVTNEMLSLPEVIEIAKQFSVPVIVDAAAEEDLRKYYEMGADLVVYSGHKAIGGPTSGLIIGKKRLIEACVLQDKGIGRAMKIGKENIMGLYFALQEYSTIDAKQIQARYSRIIEKLQAECAGLLGVQTRIVWDATRPIPRLQLIVQEGNIWTAKELISRMETHNPSIRTRNHLADQGIIQFDPRELREQETEEIAQLLRFLLNDTKPKEGEYR